MADNVELNAGTGGATLATDDVTGVHFQKVKIDVGGDGASAALGNANPLPVSDAGGSLTVDNATLSVVGGGVEATAIRVTVASDSTGVLSVDDNGSTLSIDDGAGSITVDGTVTANLAAGTNNIGDVDVLSIAAGDNNIGNVDIVTVPTDPFGANADAASATGSISAKLRFIAATGIPITALPASTNTIEVVGDAAHDAGIAGNPVRIGGRALSADYTAVSTGDTADLIASLTGKQIVLSYALPGATWSYAAASGGITNTTGVSAKAAAGAGVRNYITRAQIVNGHATVSTDVQIRDGASGTVLWRGFAQAAGGGVSSVFDPPLRGTANTLVEVACGTTGSATYFNLQGYTAAE